MVSKTKKFRGGRSHGRGRKHGRGAGNRGGKGNAGLHKHKFKTTVKYMPDHFGGYGFTRHHDGLGETFTINVEALEGRLADLIAAGFATETEGEVAVDLAKAGFGKLLGGGKVTRAMRITVPAATDKARRKVEAAGGSVETGTEGSSEASSEG